MKKIFVASLMMASISTSLLAQTTDGTTKSLVKAEKELDKNIKKNGTAAAFTDFSTPSSLFFQPNPVSAKTFFAANPNAMKDLQRTVKYVNISKSGDWAVTSGEYSSKDGKESIAGDYLTVWKVEGASGAWKIQADIETEREKNSSKTADVFLEGKDKFSSKDDGLPNAAEAAKVLETTEQTFGVMLKSYSLAAFTEFAANDIRLLFPSNNPIIGKDKMIQFFNGMVSKMSITTNKVDMAKTGDLAFSYGTAALDYKIDLRETLNYVAVWEMQEGHKWNMVALAYIPAER